MMKLFMEWTGIFVVVGIPILMLLIFFVVKINQTVRQLGGKFNYGIYCFHQEYHEAIQLLLAIISGISWAVGIAISHKGDDSLAILGGMALIVAGIFLLFMSPKLIGHLIVALQRRFSK